MFNLNLNIHVSTSYPQCHCFNHFLVVTVNFGQSLYFYSEDHGVVSDITITLNSAIAQSLTVTLSGGNDIKVL